MRERLAMSIITVVVCGVALGGPFAFAQGCPTDAVEVSRSETATQITVTCRCPEGLWYIGDKCLTYETSLDRAREELRISVLGILGKALDEVDSLERYAVTQSWPDHVRTRFLLSTLAAARAQFERAKRYLELEDPSWRGDRIVGAYGEVLDRRGRLFQIRKFIGPLVQESLDLSRVQHLQRDAARALVEASVLRGQGRFEEAIRRYEEALSLAARSGEDAMRHEIGNAITWTTALKRSRDAQLAPGQHAAALRLGRERAAAEHAWTLALSLQEAGMKENSLELFREAMEGFKNTRPSLVSLVAEQMNQVAAGGRLGGGAGFRGLYRVLGRNDIALDAVTYGRGDWNRSIAYLQLAARSDPQNASIREALAFVEGLSASQK